MKQKSWYQRQISREGAAYAAPPWNVTVHLGLSYKKLEKLKKNTPKIATKGVIVVD